MKWRALPQWMGSDESHQARKESRQLWILILQAAGQLWILILQAAGQLWILILQAAGQLWILILQAGCRLS